MIRKQGNKVLASRFAAIAVTFSAIFSGTALAAADEVSASGSLLRMVLGLAAVLGVMLLIAWLMKRLTPGLKQQSVVRIVGGVSVGTRERVVVVEVADRWLVLGVAPGQVTSLANLEPGEEIPALTTVQALNTQQSANAKPAHPFASWLKQSLQRKP